MGKVFLNFLLVRLADVSEVFFFLAILSLRPFYLNQVSLSTCFLRVFPTFEWKLFQLFLLIQYPLLIFSNRHDNFDKWQWQPKCLQFPPQREPDVIYLVLCARRLTGERERLKTKVFTSYGDCVVVGSAWMALWCWCKFDNGQQSKIFFRFVEISISDEFFSSAFNIATWRRAEVPMVEYWGFPSCKME